MMSNNNCPDTSCELYNRETKSCAVSACIKPSTSVNKIINIAAKKNKKKMDTDKVIEYAIKSKLRVARDLSLRAKREEEELFTLIADLYPNLELDLAKTNSKNASNLEEAIACYIHYGEYETKALVKEIIEAGKMS